METTETEHPWEGFSDDLAQKVVLSIAGALAIIGTKAAVDTIKTKLKDRKARKAMLAEKQE